jgi:glycosyltransferase involved in cell wall biosynthesis/ubiquinone/menaquinone biosynthesis C-methylase UbiE
MRVVFVDPSGQSGTVVEERLDDTTERHLIALPPPPLAPGDPISALAEDASLGLVVALAGGCPNWAELKLLKRGLALRRRAWLHWPEEGAVEVATPERLESYRRHWLVINLYQLVVERVVNMIRVPMRISLAMHGMPSRDMPKFFLRRVARVLGWQRPSAQPPASDHVPGDAAGPTAPPPMVRHAQRLAALREARLTAKSIPFPAFANRPDRAHPIPGCGVYLRTDFWSPILSGGSYGHTCYVAKELAAVTESFVCFMGANRFPLLDEYGVEQVVMPPPSTTSNEEDIASAVPHYLEVLRPYFQKLRPAYIYERLCLGNSVAALLSAEFRIPYIVEYNGSEVSMRRSFENAGYVYEAEYLETEALAFEQATLISVVSAEIRNTLVARGIDPAKILVNPNGVDLDAYAPAAPDERDAIRTSIGFAPSDRVIGFTGTFGGWHGIDVLSEAIPRISKNDPRAKFLLIGDGGFKHLVENAVTAFGLASRVVDVGRVPQAEGARLLRACDIFVSPHSAHMIDSKFFGSPTKVFEYMGVGAGIVASDLEQIGQVLSPSLGPDDAERGAVVADERAVLCAPGNVGQFVQAVTALVRQPEMAEALGRNARRAAAAHYSWERHVANLWVFLRGETVASDIAPDLRRKPKVSDDRPALEAVGVASADSGGSSLDASRPTVAGDHYKSQVQRQWDNDPAGSHYVVESAAHTKDWFLEAERYRYAEYAPWMAETMEFARHAGEDVLEIGGGMGTDLAQFAAHGARVTDIDLSSGHLTLAKENFLVRGLQGRFIHHDAETLIFEDNSFDVVYSNGVLHHTPNTRRVVGEIFRVLRPGGLAIVMVYAEDSLHYWRTIMWNIGLREGQLRRYSMAELMSRSVERSDNAAAHPLVKAYTRKRLRGLFDGFTDISIVQRQMEAKTIPPALRSLSRQALGAFMGWNLIIKARKPHS